jgi:predicted nucleic acid-binding protein
MIYVDSSAMVKRYVQEIDSDHAEAMLLGDPEWVTGQHTYVEVAIALARRATDDEVGHALAAFDRDWTRTAVVAIDDAVCRRAARIGAETMARSLDALHLAAAERVGMRSIPIATFDLRLAQIARSLGFSVLGA